MRRAAVIVVPGAPMRMFAGGVTACPAFAGQHFRPTHHLVPQIATTREITRGMQPQRSQPFPNGGSELN
jgi:hypothetical protein